MNSRSTSSTSYELQANTSTFYIRNNNVSTLSLSLILAPFWKYWSTSGSIFTLINSSAQLAPTPSQGSCNYYKRTSLAVSFCLACLCFQSTAATKHCLATCWLPLATTMPCSVWNLTFTCKVEGTVRTYVFHMLRTYVMILCNWLILWQNTLYL